MRAAVGVLGAAASLCLATTPGSSARSGSLRALRRRTCGTPTPEAPTCERVPPAPADLPRGRRREKPNSSLRCWATLPESLASHKEMRWRGLEPPRGINPTRPSTLRVYQFRHQRARAIVATPSLRGLSAIRFPLVRELCDEAVAAALAAGASYADARVVVRRSQTVATRNRRVDRLDDVETQGLGVRVLVGGAWGFACDNELSVETARATAARACAFAKAAPGSHGREL